jgi:hypothetical protein
LSQQSTTTTTNRLQAGQYDLLINGNHPYQWIIELSLSLLIDCSA